MRGQISRALERSYGSRPDRVTRLSLSGRSNSKVGLGRTHSRVNVRQSRGRDGELDLDRHHHALILVLHDVTMKEKASDNHGLREGNDRLHLPRSTICHRRNTEGVAQTIVRVCDACRPAVDPANEKPSLVNVKVMVLGVLIEDCPFLGVAQPHRNVGSAFVQGPTLIKNLVFSGLREKVKVRRCAIELDRSRYRAARLRAGQGCAIRRYRRSRAGPAKRPSPSRLLGESVQ
jgi:hypothetical protein